VKNGHAHFAVRRAGALLTVSTSIASSEGPAEVFAELQPDGAATIRVNDQEEVNADFYGPLLSTPADSLNVGRDEGSPVAEYRAPFAFAGKIDQITLQTLAD
jgi:hypothetical protein